MSRLSALAAAWILLAASAAWAHPPLPDGIFHPRTAAEAWNVIRLATSNIERLLAENRLAEIPDQASLCNPALRTLAQTANPLDRQRMAEQTVRASVTVISLVQAAAVGDRAFTQTTFANLRALLYAMEASFSPAEVNADVFFCPMHPDVSGTDPAMLCPKCGMSLVPRRIPYSFIYVPPGETSMRLRAVSEQALRVGEIARVHVFLSKRDGSPVLLPDLLVTHTQPIHLLIVDPALEDYHHEHPVKTSTPGEYNFSFTPTKSTGYRIFADLVPAATGVQEYATADLPGAVKTATPAWKPGSFTTTRGGLTFQLTFPETSELTLHAGQTTNLRVTICDAKGNPMARLQPVMNAFAHLVGFYDDFRTVVHLHPAGPEVVNPSLRGGPSLDFRFYPPKAGLLRLYCQVVVDGQALFAPFDLEVSP